MKVWPVQEAKARFSELLESCLREGPQLVTRRGSEAAVLVSVDRWRSLQQAARPSLKDALLADTPRFDLEDLGAPDRGHWRWRAPPEFD